MGLVNEVPKDFEADRPWVSVIGFDDPLPSKTDKQCLALFLECTSNVERHPVTKIGSILE